MIEVNNLELFCDLRVVHLTLLHGWLAPLLWNEARCSDTQPYLMPDSVMPEVLPNYLSSLLSQISSDPLMMRHELGERSGMVLPIPKLDIYPLLDFLAHIL